MARINLRNTVVTFLDSGGANTLTFGPGPGDMSVSNLVAYENEEVVEATNRSAHDGFVTGSDLRQEVSITLELDDAWTASVPNVKDWIRRTGKYDPDTGDTPLTSVDSCSWAWQVKVESTVCGVTTSFTLPKVRLMGDFSESDTASALSVSGTNYLAPTFA